MWTALLTMIPGLLDKLLPDKGAADEAKLKLLALVQTGELAQLQAQTALAQGQIDINKIEAASTRLFVAGWRPFVGWVCGAALAFKYMAAPVLVAAGLPIPPIEAGELIPVLLALLGLGAMRSYDKKQGVS